MRLEDIHVGDILRIRDWDDMEAEFGLDVYGNIKCPFLHFDVDMKYLCGKFITVADVTCDGYLYSKEKYELPDYWENSADYSWSLLSDMVEPIEYDTPDESYEPISINELKGFLIPNADEVNNGL